MTDFTDIIPAELLPDAVEKFEHVRDCHDWYQDHDERVWAERAIAAALELAASLMVCGTCEHHWDGACSLSGGFVDDVGACRYAPSRWQHYRDGEA